MVVKCDFTNSQKIQENFVGPVVEDGNCFIFIIFIV